MGFGRELGAKKRKVFYDDYTGTFYAESKVESLQRQCDLRAKLTDVINKAQDARYREACRQVDAEKQIFLMKKERSVHRHSENLQDHKAHLNVLEKLAKERERSEGIVNDIYGKYPPGSMRPDLDHNIENELKDMSPVVQRRKEANRLLGRRTIMPEANRSKSTEELFTEFKNRKSRVPSPAKSPVARRSIGALILPAITVKMVKAGEKAKITDSVTHKRMTEMMSTKTAQNTASRSKTVEDKAMPSVFITDHKGNTSPLR